MLLAEVVVIKPNAANTCLLQNHIDDVLDDSTLMGAGLASMESLRPLAVMTLCEILHHVRKTLSLAQVSLHAGEVCTVMDNDDLVVRMWKSCINLMGTWHGMAGVAECITIVVSQSMRFAAACESW